ncbi:MAG: leucyl aminopeptidase [bacterium]
MDIKTRKDLTGLKTDLLFVTKFETSKTLEKSDLLGKTVQARIDKAISNYGFAGKKKEILLTEGTDQIRRILIGGLGLKKDFGAETVRLAAYEAVNQANALKVTHLTLMVPGPNRFLKEAVEGVRLAAYQFEGLHQKKDKDQAPTLKSVVCLTREPKAKTVLHEVNTILNGVDLAKNLVNLPANVVTPGYLEKQAEAMAEGRKNVSLNVLSLEEAEKQGMGAFAAVARGSAEPARMIALHYKGNPGSKKAYAIVGKGITFDSGGISLKPSKGMGKMKTDMAGSAAALGAFKAVSELGLKVNLIVVVAATENMPGGRAYRPGDILTASNGKTIEIVNTDAEGRLVLADALVLAQKMGADRVIDIATLTGACIVTFGNIHTALMSNSDAWAKKYLAAAANSGEKTWQLPMDPEYNELIKSEVSDMVNAVETGKAGTITAAKLLENFIEEKTEWVHLDIAGTSYLDAPRGYQSKQATGVPIRTLVELLMEEAK